MKQQTKIMLLLVAAIVQSMAVMVKAESFSVTQEGDLKVIIGQLLNPKEITDLKVSGPLATEDLKSLSTLQNLEILNLEDAVFISMTGCKGMSKLRQVFLPVSVEEIGYEAFSNCKKLIDIRMPAVKVIGEYAFHGCASLTEVELPSTLRSVGAQAFYEASLYTVKVPEGVERLGRNSFYCATLETIYLPSTLTEMKGLSWYWGRNLKEVYYKGTNPLTTESFRDSKGVLYVPECSIEAFKSDFNWNVFSDIRPYPDYNAKVIEVPYTQYDRFGSGWPFYYDLSTEGIEQGAVVYNHGNLKVEGQTPVRLSSYVQSYGTSYLDGTPTMVVDAPMSALYAELNHIFYENEIRFFSSPFDIKVKDIRIEEGARLVVREYDAKRRAALRKDVWKTLSPDDVMKAGKGYVLFTDVENNEGVFVFAGDPSRGNLFANEDITVKLDTWPSELPHAANWNLVANPYPCYFSINDIEHDGVLTIWTGNRYEAYSTIDDTGYFAPFRAFFVQRTSSPEMVFRASGRYRDTKGTRISAPRQNNGQRKVFNFLMYVDGEEEVADRARIVSNPEAPIDYDMKCDAPKFERIDDSAFEIYVNDNGMRMSIDERPEGDGCAVLGVFIPDEGDYRISLDSRSRTAAVLHDIITDETVRMDLNDYVFHSEAGDFPYRFEVFFGEANGVDGLIRNAYLLDTEVFGMDGIKVGSGKASEMDLKPGVYIERIGYHSRKIIIK